MALAARGKCPPPNPTQPSLLCTLFQVLDCRGLLGTELLVLLVKLHPEKVTELGKLERKIPWRSHRAGGGHKTVHYSSGLGKIRQK